MLRKALILLVALTFVLGSPFAFAPSAIADGGGQDPPGNAAGGGGRAAGPIATAEFVTMVVPVIHWIAKL